MVTRYRAWLDNQGLHDIDPNIVIMDIQESSPMMDVTTAKRGGDGLHVLKRTRQYLTVAVRFCVYEYDVERRKSAVQKVCAWAAKGGRLTINDRPEQYLQVVTEQLPAVNSALRWQGEMSIIFTAYGVPYWQDEYPEQATGSGQSGSVVITPKGDKPEIPLECKITSTGGTLTRVKIAANGREIAFEGLQLGNGESISIAYEDGLQRLPVRYRTAESADEILLYSGRENEVTFEADSAVSVTIKARGAWM